MQNGLLNGAPYLSLSILSLVIGWFSDVLRKNNIATATTIRKVCDSACKNIDQRYSVLFSVNVTDLRVKPTQGGGNARSYIMSILSLV